MLKELNFAIIYSALSVVIISIISLSAAVDWTKNTFLFCTKKILDCIVYLSLFFSIISQHYFSKFSLTKSHTLVASFIFSIVICIFAIILIVEQLISLCRIIEKAKVDKSVFFMIFSLLFGILMCFATINYTIYAIREECYKIPQNLSFLEIAFEFVFYTFSLITTYSCASIEPATLITKIVQMLEVGSFYIIFGTIVAKLFTNIGSQPKTKGEKNIEK